MAYCKAFYEQWKKYEKCMVTYDNDGNIAFIPSGFYVKQWPRFCLVLVTHDESTFYAHDRRKNYWSPDSASATSECKGEGPSLMISELMTNEWVCLSCREEEDEYVTYFCQAIGLMYFTLYSQA